MTTHTENSVRALPFNSEEAFTKELNLITSVLERLFESDEAQFPEEEISNDLLKIIEAAQRIREAETLSQKFDIYYTNYRPLSNELKAKYSDFLDRDTFREIEVHNKYMNGLNEFIKIQVVLLLAEKEPEKTRQCELLYTGVVRLSDLVEEYLPYFSQGLIECIKNIASAFLNDPNLRPDKISQDEKLFPCLIGLKNAARAILWQIEEHLKNGGESRLTNSLAMNPDLAREMQIQKNQAAIDWAKSRLEQLESIRTAKG